MRLEMPRSAADLDRVFEFGLGLLLDGFARAAARKRG